MSDPLQAGQAASTDSVARGGIALSLSRVVGMGSGFLLFLLIAWRSREDAGIFRTAATYLTISEFLPLLGMHRWLATEMAAQAHRRRGLFRISAYFAAAVSTVIAIVYVTIASIGIYSPTISHAIFWVAAAAVGSGLSLCINSALVGMGQTHSMGMLNLAENLSRSVVGIVLVLLGHSVISIIAVFVVIRWLAALAGLLIVENRTTNTDPEIGRPLVRAFLSQVPNLATGVLCTIVIRYTAMVVLPWLRDESEAGLYAAPFQLFDLLMLIPTVVIYSSNFVFCESALKSRAALRQSTNQLVYLAALYIFPFVALAVVFAQPIIVFLFKAAFLNSVTPFRILMLAAPLFTLDQVLSQAMVTSGHYRQDVASTVAGSAVALIGTCLLSPNWGSVGAALALLAATFTTVGVRLVLLRALVSLRLLLTASNRQMLAAVAAGIAAWLLARACLPMTITRSATWMLLVPPALAANLLMLYQLGALSPVRRKRMRQFLSRRS